MAVHGRNRERRVINSLAQQLLIADGVVHESRGVALADGRRLCVGDEVVARHGDRSVHPAGDRSGWMRNGTTGQIVEASAIDASTNRSELYVDITRGRHSNHPGSPKGWLLLGLTRRAAWTVADVAVFVATETPRIRPDQGALIGVIGCRADATDVECWDETAERLRMTAIEIVLRDYPLLRVERAQLQRRLTLRSQTSSGRGVA